MMCIVKAGPSMGPNPVTGKGILIGDIIESFDMRYPINSRIFKEYVNAAGAMIPQYD